MDFDTLGRIQRHVSYRRWRLCGENKCGSADRQRVRARGSEGIYRDGIISTCNISCYDNGRLTVCIGRCGQRTDSIAMQRTDCNAAEVVICDGRPG